MPDIVENSAHPDSKLERGSTLDQQNTDKDARTSKRSLLIEVQSVSEASRRGEVYRLYKRRFAGLAALVSSDVIVMAFSLTNASKRWFSILFPECQGHGLAQ